MREILFRGKTDDGEWKYGALLNTTYFDFSTYIIGQEMSDGKYSSKNDHYEVDPKSVGQFTGLTDKNGTKLFEGDLLKWTSTDTDGSLITQIDEIKWSKYGWICGKELQCLADYLLFDPSYENLELYGNIHEVQHE